MYQQVSLKNLLQGALIKRRAKFGCDFINAETRGRQSPFKTNDFQQQTIYKLVPIEYPTSAKYITTASTISRYSSCRNDKLASQAASA
jgi:hypothetical protein